MALGDNTDNNGKRTYYEPSVRSPYGTSNIDGVDPSNLFLEFYGGFLKVGIAPKLAQAKPDDKHLWDYNNAALFWLTPYSAKMLIDEIDYVMSHIDECNNGGVSTRKGDLISFSNGKELGATSPCIIIRKIDPDSGEATSVYAYQFKCDYHRSIRNYNPSDPSNFQSNIYPNLEIDLFRNALVEFVNSMSGAGAYANMYFAKFDIQKTNTKLGLIMDKLGIEKPEYGKRSGYNGSENRSFFNSHQNQTPTNNNMRNATMEDLMNDDE